MTRFRDLVEAGDQLVLTGEAPAIDGGTLEVFNGRIAEMAQWVDAMNATDNTAAHAHASNVACAIAIAQAGVEPILQVVCRDKNRIACQADMVGAALHGIHNICCLTGDDVTAGDEPEARRVFDLDGPQLIRVAAALSRGHYLSGRKLDPAPPLFVGAVENPGAPPLDYRPAAGRQEDRGRSPLPATADLLSPRPPRGVRRGARTAGADLEGGDPAHDRARARRAGPRLHGSRGARHRRARRDHRADRASRRPGRGCVSARPRAGASRSRAPGRTRPAPDGLPPRRRPLSALP